MSWAIEMKDYSQRRACALVGIAPRAFRYQSSRPDDAGLRQRLRELSSERRRFGYRRLHLLLKREGIAVNWKKLYRIYKEERLTVRKRGGRKRALGTRAPMAVPQDPNQRWSLDFVSDTLVDGRRFRILCVIDDFSRECLTAGSQRRMALHRAGQTHAKRLCGELQRQTEGRVPQRAPVPQLPACPRDHRRMEDRLQPEPTPHEPRRAHPERVCNPVTNGPKREQR